MKFGPIGHDEPPRELLIVAGVLASIVGAIAILIVIFYTPFPRPSPYGCYQSSGTPLIRLSPDFIIVPGTAHPRRRVTFDRGNTGLLVNIFDDQPYATFMDGKPAEPRLYLPPNETMLVIDERRTTPTLNYDHDGTYVTIPKVDCPRRT